MRQLLDTSRTILSFHTFLWTLYIYIYVYIYIWWYCCYSISVWSHSVTWGDLIFYLCMPKWWPVAWVIIYKYKHYLPSLQMGKLSIRYGNMDEIAKYISTAENLRYIYIENSINNVTKKLFDSIFAFLICGQLTHINVNKLGHHLFRRESFTYMAPNQAWRIINGTLRKTLTVKPLI